MPATALKINFATRFLQEFLPRISENFYYERVQFQMATCKFDLEFDFGCGPIWSCTLRYCGVVVITTAQVHSTKPELKLCAGSSSAPGVSDSQW